MVLSAVPPGGTQGDISCSVHEMTSHLARSLVALRLAVLCEGGLSKTFLTQPIMPPQEETNETVGGVQDQHNNREANIKISADLTLTAVPPFFSLAAPPSA